MGVQELSVNSEGGPGRLGAALALLSRTERALFMVLATEPDRWINARELVSGALGTHHRSGTSLVRVHVHNIRKKLGSLSCMIESRRGRGYRCRGSF